jgi:hypothetical protein
MMHRRVPGRLALLGLTTAVWRPTEFSAVVSATFPGVGIAEFAIAVDAHRPKRDLHGGPWIAEPVGMSASTDPHIPGIHSYCDRCCWRCRLSDRCAVFAKAWGAIDAASPPLPNNAVTAAVTAALMQAVESMRSPPAGGFSQGLVSTPGLRSTVGAYRQREVHLDRNPLVIASSHYARTAWPILQALRPVLASRGDEPSLTAAERLEEICITVASKVYRAVSSALEEGENGSLQTQSDANGSAKVALLLVEESRRAWRVLMEPGRAAANGAPAALVRMLDDLEAGVRLQFPRAEEFVRPGFDTVDCQSIEGRVAAAVRAPPQQQGRA